MGVSRIFGVTILSECCANYIRSYKWGQLIFDTFPPGFKRSDPELNPGWRERLPGYGLTPLKPGSNALYELSNNIRPD